MNFDYKLLINKTKKIQTFLKMCFLGSTVSLIIVVNEKC